MKSKAFFLYLAAFLVLLIPSPGRFVYGFTLMIELFFLTTLGTLVLILIKKLKLVELKTVLLLFSLIVITVIFRQIFILLYPEVVLTLGFIIYLPAISTFLICFFSERQDFETKQLIIENIIRAVIFFVFGTLFFLFRDVVGYGTITFFGKHHQIVEKVIFNSEQIGIFSFLASVPGALLLSALITFLHLTVRKKFKIISNYLQQ